MTGYGLRYGIRNLRYSLVHSLVGASRDGFSSRYVPRYMCTSLHVSYGLLISAIFVRVARLQCQRCRKQSLPRVTVRDQLRVEAIGTESRTDPDAFLSRIRRRATPRA